MSMESKPFRVAWSDYLGAYSVSIPNWNGGDVYHAADYDSIVAERDALAERNAELVRLLQRFDCVQCRNTGRKFVYVSEVTDLDVYEDCAVCADIRAAFPRPSEVPTAQDISELLCGAQGHEFFGDRGDEMRCRFCGIAPRATPEAS